MTLAEVTDRGQAAIEELLVAMREGWTGEVRLHFHNGEPKVIKRIETRTRNLDDNELDADRTNGYK